MASLAELSDRELMLLLFDLYDTLATSPGEQRAEIRKSIETVATEIWDRNYKWLCASFRRYRKVDEEPEWLAVETLARVFLAKDGRYDASRPLKPWIKGIARKVLCDYARLGWIADAELVQRLPELKERESMARSDEERKRPKKEQERIRNKLDRRYRLILTAWFRAGMKTSGLDTAPKDVKPLVDETLRRVFDAAAQFDQETTDFVVWLSAIAREVLSRRAAGPIPKMPDVPERLPVLSVPLPPSLGIQRASIGRFSDPNLVWCWQNVLSERERQVLWLVDVQGRGADEVGQILSPPVTGRTVDNIASGARKKLREGLHE